MLTINQIVNKLQEIQEEHAQLNDFRFGDPFEYGANNPIEYPFLGAALVPGSLEKRKQNIKLLLFVADLVNKDESNETEVLSDTQLILLDIYAQLWEYLEENSIELAANATLSDFTERWDDEVSGWQTEITISQFYSRDTCQVPAKPTNIPPEDAYLQSSISSQEVDGRLTILVGEESGLFNIQGEGLSPLSGNITVTISSSLEFYDGSTWKDFNDTILIPYTSGKIFSESIYKLRMVSSGALETFNLTGGKQTVSYLITDF